MHYTPHQRGIIKRYYEHKDDLMVQKLTELVSNLYLAETEKEKDKLWDQAERALVNLKVAKGEVRRIVDGRDVAALAKMVERQF